MKNNLSRRQFMASLTAGSTLAGLSCKEPNPGVEPQPTARFFFISQGKTALMNADGSGLRLLDFNEPDQVTWQPADFFRDGRRVLFLSMEARRDGPGRPFNEYYTQTPTHIWVYDLEDESLTEIATKKRMAVFYTPQLLLGDGRMLVQVALNKVGQVFSMNLDGSEGREFTGAGEGLPYGFDLNRETKRVAFHLAGPSGYQIWTSDFEGQNRSLVAARQDHLYFGPSWSPDGDWLAYQDCHRRQDPGHDWSDVCVSRPMGPSNESLPRASLTGLAPAMAVRGIAAAVQICSLGRKTGQFSSHESWRTAKCLGNFNRVGQTRTTSTETTNRSWHEVERRSVRLIP